MKVDYVNPDIWELEVFHGKRSPKAVWKLIRRLYDGVLYDDSVWHFLYEGSFFVLRLHRLSAGPVEVVLRKGRWRYRGKLDGGKIGRWGPDSRPGLRKFQMLFTPILHNYSLLVLHMVKEDDWGVADRVFHCFCNMLSYSAMIRSEQDPALGEAYFMGHYAIERAIYIGKYLQQKGSGKM